MPRDREYVGCRTSHASGSGIARACGLLLASVLCGELAAEDAPATFDGTVKPFLATYCVECHGEQEQNGERRFDRLAGAIADEDALAGFQDILDQLNLSEMPPADAPQPPVDERLRVVGWLTREIERFSTSHESAVRETVLRRLNAREYRNTVRDLLHLNMTMFDPTAAFPRDQEIEHLDNVGGTLVTSGYLLEQYLAAADQVIERAMTPLERPEVRTWTFRDGFRQQPEIDQVHRHTSRFEWMTLYDVVGADKHEGAYGPIHEFAEGVPVDGVYEIRIRAEAVNRLHPYDPEFFGTDPDEPFRLGIVPGDRLAGQLHKPQPIEPLLAEITLADALEWYTVRVWLDAGFTPRFTFRNGLMDVRSLYARLIRRYPDQFPGRGSNGIVEARRNAIEFGKLPQIRIHEIEIEGPLYDTWPTPSHRALLGDDWERIQSTGEFPPDEMRDHLTAFVSRAYRRPARPAEIDRLMQVIAARQAEGLSPLEAWGDGLKAALCSPNFLYLEEADDDRLSSYALASRLSCFLWSSMPDEELLQLAATDDLEQPEILAAQAERLLADPKSDAFVDGFLGSWLTMRELGAAPPDRESFPGFYQYDLDAAMRRETHLFTRHLLDENLGIVNFLDADFAFVNSALADHYGLDPIDVPGFHRVPLPDRRRGGLLGQASVLTVTANGIDTSPVVRGVWLLENILGTPPSPPPPDVEPLDPDIRGATTIRDQLNRHRDVATCYDCHRRIDPLGFALENFDPIGGWREAYGREGAIDPSGELPGGESFDNIEEFKTILVSRQDQFARALTTRLLAYALGRETGPADRVHVDRIIAEVDEREGGFRDLVKLVAGSEAFRSK